ncbi:unnamed protein product, partial [Polarella glacialis]
ACGGGRHLQAATSSAAFDAPLVATRPAAPHAAAAAERASVESAASRGVDAGGRAAWLALAGLPFQAARCLRRGARRGEPRTRLFAAADAAKTGRPRLGGPGLNKEIAAVKTAREVLELCEASLDRFDAVNMATAFYRIAKARDGD